MNVGRKKFSRQDPALLKSCPPPEVDDDVTCRGRREVGVIWEERRARERETEIDVKS